MKAFRENLMVFAVAFAHSTGCKCEEEDRIKRTALMVEKAWDTLIKLGELKIDQEMDEAWAIKKAAGLTGILASRDSSVGKLELKNLFLYALDALETLKAPSNLSLAHELAGALGLIHGPSTN